MTAIPKPTAPDSLEKLSRPDAEWKQQLTPEQYRVTRKAGTERAFSGVYHNEKTAGMYHCICCGLELFDSGAKYDSGTGWPSFYQPAEQAHVEEHTDRSFFMVRTEVACARCEAHLGHVFPDGPKPSGMRYCINSASLMLKPR